MSVANLFSKVEGDVWKLLVLWAAVGLTVLTVYGPAVAMYVDR